MTYKYSNKSLEKIREAHTDLQKIANELIRYMDVKILCGFRDERAQDVAYAEGKSGVKWPNSAHNKMPSLALDIAPYPIDWSNIERFKVMRLHIYAIAKNLDIKLKPIIKFKNGGYDYPHIELKI